MEWKWLNEPKKATDSSRLIRCEVQVRMLLDEVLQSTHLFVPGNANDLWYGKSNIEVQRGLGVGNNIISARLSAYMSYPAMFTSIHMLIRDVLLSPNFKYSNLQTHTPAAV